MKKVVVTLLVAQAAVKSWLDAKRVNEKHRLANEDSIDHLTDAFEDGTLSLDKDNNIIMNLVFPIGVDGKIETLTFKPRLTVVEIHNAVKGLKSGDGDARILAYMTTLTDQPTAVVNKMDTEDYRVASSVVVFFF